MRKSPSVRIVAHSSSARFNLRDVARARDLNGTRGSNPWEQYSFSKAGLCLLVRALNGGGTATEAGSRLAAAGIRGGASAADPGLAATGVNVQHDLARTLGLPSRGIAKDTKAYHDVAAWHAAYGALPLVLAALTAAPNQMFSGAGTRSRSLDEAARVEKPVRASGALDQMLWPAVTVEHFWQQLVHLLELDEG